MIRVEGPGLLDVNVWRNPSSMTVHLVNLTNPMTMKGPFRDFFPVGPLKVKIQLPIQIRAMQARMLVAGGVASVEISGGRMSVTVPSILDHEVIAIDV